MVPLSSNPKAPPVKDAARYVSIHHASMVFDTRNGAFIAVRDIILDIAKGEFVSLIGHSGCGKSTLLNLVAGLATPTTGALLCADLIVKNRCYQGLQATTPITSAPTNGFRPVSFPIFPAHRRYARARCRPDPRTRVARASLRHRTRWHRAWPDAKRAAPPSYQYGPNPLQET